MEQKSNRGINSRIAWAHKDRESALVQVVDTTYSDGIVEYHLGTVLELIK